MIDRTIVQTILLRAINAPSGANSQPWSFALSGEALQITIHPEKDHKILNYKDRGTLITLGALLENIRLAAQEQKLEMEVSDYDPDAHRLNVVFKDWNGSITKEDQKLLAALPLRCTNRKHYKKDAVDHAALQAIEAAGEGEGVTCTLLIGEAARTAVARSFALFEQIMIEDDRVRKASFSEIIWPGKNVRSDHSGLYIETLELKPPQQMALSLMQKPFFAKTAKKIGLPKVIRRENTALYASAPAMGFLMIPHATNEAFITAGKHFERVWLTATAYGLSLQPMTGTLFLKYFSDAEPAFFSTAHAKAIGDEFKTIALHASAPEGSMIAMAFRIGHSDPPSRLSEKARPLITEA